MLEKSLEAKLVVAVKKSKGMCIKFFCQEFTGLPDRIVLLPIGKLGFVEVKKPGEKVDPAGRQALVARMLTRLGFRTFVLDNEKQIADIILKIQA